MTRRWPDPSDTALDRARAIARSYRGLVLDLAAGRCTSGEAATRCAAFDAASRELGEHWIAPTLDTVAEGELVSTEQAAQYFGVDQATVRSWVSRKEIPVYRYGGKLDMAELLAYRASQRRRRGHR